MSNFKNHSFISIWACPKSRLSKASGASLVSVAYAQPDKAAFGSGCYRLRFAPALRAGCYRSHLPYPSRSGIAAIVCRFRIRKGAKTQRLCACLVGLAALAPNT